MSRNQLDIQLLAMDVDGVLTDGGIIIHDDGSETKKFHVQDGTWLRIWKRTGRKTAIITGRECSAVAHRAGQLGIDFLYQKAHDKLAVFEQLKQESGIPAEGIAYIGDDVMDLPIIKRAAFGVAVANAAPLLFEYADYITTTAGGQGAVQEIVALLLKKMCLWNQAMERYLK